MTLQVLSEEQLLYLVEVQLPDLLERHPEWETRIYSVLLKMFARREEVAAIMTELRELRTEMNERFEQVDARFVQVDARFVQVDAHLEHIDTRLEQIDTRFDRVEHRLEKIDDDIVGLRDWMELNVGRVQTRSGRQVEDVIASALRFALKRPDIRPESILLRQKITDVDGRIFPSNRSKEVDIVATDGEYLLFEVKSAAKVDDVDDFAEKLALARLLYPDKTVNGVFISLAAWPDVQNRCHELGIELLK